MDKKYRINTDIGTNKVLDVHLKQDVDTLEILSLKMNQKDLYQLQESDYGIVIGRVLANESFGIPNTRLSIFVEVSDDEIEDIKQFYPYISETSKDSSGIKYNLLPNIHNDVCKRAVGTLPSKEELLDNDVYIEIFDKYLKYTTVTNNAGDYMIFGVPTGSHTLHMSLDLSDIGILSQKPIDMIYKGHDINEFDSPTQFKDSTNLDDLAQIIQQDQSVTIYPLWGDKQESVAAITRCDIQVNYKFEPTCVFLGSIVSDNKSNAVNHKCQPKAKTGSNSQLTTGTGTIEMIRKTTNGLVESYQIKGNRLIDEDGVWCYQIPMNLDYISTDEYGNIVASKNPNTGIPTRSRVRFRISKDDTGDEGFSQHTAKYLVPNNPNLSSDGGILTIADPKNFKKHFQFGSATLEEDYRDLYWNNVYTVKNYIPKIQAKRSQSIDEYGGLKNANVVEDQNPLPFNSARFKLPFMYVLLCIVIEILIIVITILNYFIAALNFLLNDCLADSLGGGGGWVGKIVRAIVKPLLKLVLCLPQKLLKMIFSKIPGFSWLFDIACLSIKGVGDTPNTVYAPGCASPSAKKNIDCPDPDYPNCKIEGSGNELMDQVQRMLAVYYNIIRLDLTNDWVNGTLYLPLWYWKKRKKKSFLFGLFTIPGVNQYCDCSKKKFTRNRLWKNCSFKTGKDLKDSGNDIEDTSWHKRKHSSAVTYRRGMVQSVQNKDGLEVYYYTPYVPTYDADQRSEIEENTDAIKGVLMYATDLLLLGNLNESNLYGIPQLFKYLPPTTSNPPDIATSVVEDDQVEQDNEEGEAAQPVAVTGMDWGRKGDEQKPKYKTGLLLDLGCTSIDTKAKTCVNLDRVSEFGVDLDMDIDVEYNNGTSIQSGTIEPDGMITKYELFDNEHRAMFATLNHIGFNPTNDNAYRVDEQTGYEVPRFKYLYPTNFDGHMAKSAQAFTSSYIQKTEDEYDSSYVLFRQGEEPHFYSGGKGFEFPVFNNSFYFYFGLNPGKTAIEKFTGSYLAVCEANEQYPFSVDVESQAASSCNTWDEEKKTGEKINPYIIIDMDDVEMPYSYVVTDYLGNEVFRDGDISIRQLKLGYEIANGAYTGVLNGNMYAFNSGLEATPLQNIIYNITITDVNGNHNKVRVDLRQEKLSIISQNYDLGLKYYDGITQKKDVCNDKQLYGVIYINKVIVDGIENTITGMTKESESCVILETKNDIEIDGRTISHTIKLTFAPSEEGETMESCGCNGGVDPKVTIKDELDDGRVVLYIYKPMTYIVTIEQVCNDEILLTNRSIQNITINNGSDFLGFINKMPLKLILGNKDYNDNFYPKSTEYDKLITGKTTQGWFNAHKPQVYDLDLQLNESTIKLWNSFLQGNGEITIIDEGAYSRVATAKLNGVVSMAAGAYEVYDGTAMFQMTTDGGTVPILQRMESFDLSGVDTKAQIKANAAKSVFTENSTYLNTPNLSDIVTTNYKYGISEGDQIKFENVTKTSYNPYIVGNVNSDSQWMGQYFAAFTKNGGITDAKTGKINEKIKFLSLPKNADPNPYANRQQGKPIGKDLVDTFSEFQGTKWDFLRKYAISPTRAPYFRTMTIDRRVDYDFFILATSLYEDLEISSDVLQNYLWRTGRLSGITYNGIELAYNNDEDRSVISTTNEKQLEYSYFPNHNGNNKGKIRINELNGVDDTMRRLYDANIGNIIDIRDKFWSTEPSKMSHMKKMVSKNWYKILFGEHDIDALVGKETIDKLTETINELGSKTSIQGALETIGNVVTSLTELDKFKYAAQEILNLHLYYFDHSNHKSLYNGAFSYSNYPTKRLIDIGGIPPLFSNLDISLVPNDYNKIKFTASRIEKDDGDTGDTTTVTTNEPTWEITSEMGDTMGGEEANISLQGALKVISKEWEENVELEYNNGVFYARSLDFQFGLGDNDDNIATYNVYLQEPRIMRVMDGNNISLSMMRSGATKANIDTTIDRYTTQRVTNVSGVDEAEFKEVRVNGEKRTELIVGDDYRTSMGDIEYNKLIFSASNSRLGEKDRNVLAVLLKEELESGSNDNLTKRIMVYSSPLMIDLRKIKMQLIKTEVVDSNGTNDDTEEVQVTDESGATHTETNSVSSDNTQSRLYFIIEVPGNNVDARKLWNHSFMNGDKLSFLSEWMTYPKGQGHYSRPKEDSKTTVIEGAKVLTGTTREKLIKEYLQKETLSENDKLRHLVFYIDWNPDMGKFDDQNFNLEYHNHPFRSDRIYFTKLFFIAQIRIKINGGLTYLFRFTFSPSGDKIRYLPYTS